MAVTAATLTNTGDVSLTALPFPSSPMAPSPHVYTFPLLVSASVISWPAATAVAVSPAGSVTLTGVDELRVVPLPSWPKPLLPQSYTLPFEPSATLWSAPAATAVAVTPAGMDTTTGVDELVVVPFPSSPSEA